MLADDIYKDVNGPGYPFFVSRVASIVESALLSGQDNISIDRLLTAFDDAREYAEKEGKK